MCLSFAAIQVADTLHLFKQKSQFYIYTVLNTSTSFHLSVISIEVCLKGDGENFSK